MTDKQALLALADQCEAAPPEQQRALLEEARRLLFPAPEFPAPEMDDLHLSSSPYWAWVSAEILFGTQLDYHAYVDAALSMLPEGWFWSVTMRGEKRGGFHACCVKGGPMIWHDGSTPALAILAALMRAKAQEVE